MNRTIRPGTPLMSWLRSGRVEQRLHTRWRTWRDSRAQFPGSNLADLYDPLTMGAGARQTRAAPAPGPV